MVIVGLIAAAVLLPLFVLVELTGAGAHARPVASSASASTRRRRRRGLPQRPLALRADVPVRLLLPGRRRSTSRSRPGVKLIPLAPAMLVAVAARRLVGRPARLARAGRRRDADQRRRPRRDDDARRRTTPVLGVRAPGSRSSASARGSSTRPNTAAMMGGRAAVATRDGLGHADDAPEHGRRDLDLVDAHDHDGRGCPKNVLFRIFSGLATGLPQKQLDAVHREPARGRARCSPRPRSSGALVSLLRPSHRPERAA